MSDPRSGHVQLRLPDERMQRPALKEEPVGCHRTKLVPNLFPVSRSGNRRCLQPRVVRHSKGVGELRFALRCRIRFGGSEGRSDKILNVRARGDDTLFGVAAALVPVLKGTDEAVEILFLGGSGILDFGVERKEACLLPPAAAAALFICWSDELTHC